jgi:hypothetical protein
MMTAFILKIIAVITMSIDHIGAVFPYDTPYYFRSIGRIAMPIYVYLIAEGCTYSKNINKYMIRLGIFALISEIPFDLAFGNAYITEQGFSMSNFTENTNVFYTMFLGVACINVYEKLKVKQINLLTLFPLAIIPAYVLFSDELSIFTIRIILLVAVAIIVIELLLKTNKSTGSNSGYVAFLYTLPIAILGHLLDTDYGVFAVLWIFAIFLQKHKEGKLIVLAGGIFFEYGLPLVMYANYVNFNSILSFILAMTSVVLIYLYKGVQGKKLKWAFYVFYPAHLIILYLASNLIGF